MSDIAAGDTENDRNEPDQPDQFDRDERETARPSGPRPPVRRGGSLRFYKPGQGYYTRIWTAVGGTVIALWGAAEIFDQLSSVLDVNARYRLPVSYGVAAGVVVGLGAFLYWLVGMSRRANDFFIATEGEMKKVSWSSRKEVVRSTKVVIATVVLLGALLFMVDLAFMWFFNLLGVLKAFPGFAKIFGLQS